MQLSPSCISAIVFIPVHVSKALSPRFPLAHVLEDTVNAHILG